MCVIVRLLLVSTVRCFSFPMIFFVLCYVHSVFKCVKCLIKTTRIGMAAFWSLHIEVWIACFVQNKVTKLHAYCHQHAAKQPPMPYGDLFYPFRVHIFYLRVRSGLQRPDWSRVSPAGCMQLSLQNSWHGNRKASP